ncbi:4-phospho-D-threonate 3-dehydrogenase, partial [Cutibacterium acnes]
DHGTAFDIAGQGAASPMTMQSALHVASDFARFVPVIREEYLPSTGRN